MKSSGTRFAKRVKYQLDFPGLNCGECLEFFQTGELRAFPCRRCPNVRFPLDEVSDLTLEAQHLLASLSTGMGPPPFQFVMDLLNIRVPSVLAREVIERLAILWKIHRERDDAQKQQVPRNGHQAAQPDRD